MRRFYLLLAVAMVAVVSCQREYHWEETELLLDSGNSPRIVGGEEINPSLPPNVLNVTDSLPNPYAISNMRLAYQNAISKYGESVFGSFDINDIVLTHYYVKFEPETEDELDNLVEYFKEDDITFFDYPIECETYGEGMVEAPLTGIMPLYASIPSNITLPFFCDYTVLDSIFIPDDQEGIVTTLNANGVPIEAMDILLDEAYNAVGIENTRASAKWRPNGRIIVWDDLLGEFVPVEGVKVVAHCGLKTAKGITDENGYFSVSKTFNRAVKYSIVWEDEYWDIRQGKTKQARYHNGNKTTASWNVTFNNYSSNRNYAHLHRTLRYHFYEDSKGAGRVSSNKKLKVSYIHGASEDGYAAYFTPNAIGGIKTDIVVYGRTGTNFEWSSSTIISNLFHELGHATMFTGVSINDYREKDSTIKEPWACFYSWLHTYYFYEKYDAGDKIREKLKYNNSLVYYDVPSNLNKQYWTKGDDEYNPLVIDLFDNNNQRWWAINNVHLYNRTSNLYPNDEIHIFPTNENTDIVKDLVFDATSNNNFLNLLRNNRSYLNISEAKIQTYISSYYYYNITVL